MSSVPQILTCSYPPSAENHLCSCLRWPALFNPLYHVYYSFTAKGSTCKRVRWRSSWLGHLWTALPSVKYTTLWAFLICKMEDNACLPWLLGASDEWMQNYLPPLWCRYWLFKEIVWRLKNQVSKTPVYHLVICGIAVGELLFFLVWVVSCAVRLLVALQQIITNIAT